MWVERGGVKAQHWVLAEDEAQHRVLVGADENKVKKFYSLP